MKYPAKRRIWYNNQRLDTIDIEALPYIIPNTAVDNVFYQLKYRSMPFDISIINDSSDVIMHITRIRSIWLSMTAICVSYNDTLFSPTGSCFATNCYCDISNKFVNITESDTGTIIHLYQMPPYLDKSDDSELTYPYTWLVPFRQSTVGTDLADEVMPVQYAQFQHDDPFTPPHPSLTIKSTLKEEN